MGGKARLKRPHGKYRGVGRGFPAGAHVLYAVDLACRSAEEEGTPALVFTALGFPAATDALSWAAGQMGAEEAPTKLTRFRGVHYIHRAAHWFGLRSKNHGDHVCAFTITRYTQYDNGLEVKDSAWKISGSHHHRGGKK